MKQKSNNKTNVPTVMLAKPGTMPVFLDLENGSPVGIFSDEELSQVILKKFDINKKKIGKRYKEIKKIGISYHTESVKLYNQAKELFCLGYFESSIIVCRSVAEYLAFEIFVEQINLKVERDKIETIAENLDFRKIVNTFLVDKEDPLIDKNTKRIFNELYDIGNDWVHPKRKKEKEGMEVKSKKTLDSLTELMQTLRNALNDMTPVNGILCKKPGSRNYVNGIKLAEK